MTDQSSLVGVAGRYAEALFELAGAANALDKIAGDLDALARMLDESADMRSFVRSPMIATADQARAIVALAEAAGFDALTIKFLGVVAKNRRLFALADVIAAYRALLAAQRNQSTAEVASAQPLSAENLADLSAILKSSTGKDVAINARVDANLLGGLVVKIGSRMIDTSLRTKLDNLQIAMKGVQ